MANGAVPRGRIGPPEGRGVRGRLLSAAHELFTKKGYWATTTKEICIHANVSEASLFRNFGTKAECFEASVVESFREVFERWTAWWIDLPADTTLHYLAASWVEGLYDLVRQDRRVFQELMAAHSD